MNQEVWSVGNREVEESLAYAAGLATATVMIGGDYNLAISGMMYTLQTSPDPAKLKNKTGKTTTKKQRSWRAVLLSSTDGSISQPLYLYTPDASNDRWHDG